MGVEHVRASDADREKIVEQLRRAMNEGRLTLHEYDDRLQQVYAAKTYGELTPLLSDLPTHRVKHPRESPRIPQWVVIMWIPWVFVSLLCLLIWLATGAGYFWPFWVAVPWGMALLIPTAIGITMRGNGSGPESPPTPPSPPLPPLPPKH
ncbi:DUF1707 domain-containing protein [Nocardia iowensis]|uniref:DUF1707 domain-containing protein n=1 Tax=Nocardia iowensis TaxID=204891 RepID=UPI001FEA5E17|nr:DUF1707 domain-containing protein [Nocardia iowensis]